MFLRALQTQGKLEVLSKLNMVASDNQESNLESGQRVPLITASRVTDQGDTINSIQYENIGILLAVTPRISADGFVKLDVAPEISSLSTSGVEIANGVRAPIINRRIARTTLTVQDGHTIIIGGLISTTDEIREDKMPLLGDLPLLGPLFRSTSRSKDRTELLIVLTPHILRTPMQAAEATRKEIENSLLLRSLKVRRLRQKAMDQLLRASDPNDPNAPARPSLPADDGPLSDPLDGPLPADPTEPAPIESEARPIRLDRLTDPQRLPARGKEAS
jgi:type II secretory pathway component GspD/PulD (secretin)